MIFRHVNLKNTGRAQDHHAPKARPSGPGQEPLAVPFPVQ